MVMSTRGNPNHKNNRFLCKLCLIQRQLQNMCIKGDRIKAWQRLSGCHFFLLTVPLIEWNRVKYSIQHLFFYFLPTVIVQLGSNLSWVLRPRVNTKSQTSQHHPPPPSSTTKNFRRVLGIILYFWLLARTIIKMHDFWYTYQSIWVNSPTNIIF